MSARAPQAIQKLFADIKAGLPGAVLSGIVGDQAHSFGYHLARRDLPPGDYSVQMHRDRLGPSDAASALDITLPPGLMRTVTARLHNAAVARDPRLQALREFCGTLDGRNTYPWDLSTNSSEGVGSWDDSHLWHVHLSFYREFADSYAALAPIADVITHHPAPAGNLLEEIVALDRNSTDYKNLVADVAAAVSKALNDGHPNIGGALDTGRVGDKTGDSRKPHYLESFFFGIPGYRSLRDRGLQK